MAFGRGGRTAVFANRFDEESLFPLEVSVKKKLTFSFLPWAAAAGVCLGGTFARGQEPTPAAPAAEAAVEIAVLPWG